MIESLKSHINEFFRRIKRIGIAFIIVLAAVFIFNPLKLTYSITDSFTVYVFKLISENSGLIKIIIIYLFESLFTDLYLGITISLMILTPYFLYNNIALILPGSTVREKKLLKISLIPGTIMFIIGISFGWYLLIQIMFHFTANLDPTMGIEPAVFALRLIILLLKTTFSIGMLFEMPLIISSLAHSSVVNVRVLQAKRRYVVAELFLIALLISLGSTGRLKETALGLIFSGPCFSGIAFGKFVNIRKKGYMYGVET